MALIPLADLAGNLDVSTEQVLTALRIVATRAGVPDLAHWAARELEGYEEDDELPAHRTWHLSIVASLHNPVQGFVQNTHIGDFFIPEKYREKVTIYECREGLGQIEHLLSTTDGSEMHVEHPNLAMLINQSHSLGPGWTCTHATAKFSSMHLQSIVKNARQTALKLCLECEKEDVVLQSGSGADTTPEERKAWLDTLKDEGTKQIVRGIWDTLWDKLTS